MSRGRVHGVGATLPGTRRLPPHLTRRPRLARRLRGRRDDGFVLLESIVSITLITVIMAALTSLFVTVIRVDSEQRARQVAVQVADSTASYLRSLPPSDLLTGRTASAVDAQWSGAPGNVQPYLAAMEKGLPATSGGTTVLPLTLPPQVVHGISYTVNIYLGWCHTAVGGGSTACVRPAPTDHDQLRAVIGVTWGDRHCAGLSAGNPTPTCVYVSATFISPLSDPVFNLNQPASPAPVIVLPSFAGFAVGDTVRLQMGVQPGTGVPLFTWALAGGTWPPGVTMDTTGLVSGIITAQGPMPQLTVTVTDGFVRTVSATFTWAVSPALQGTGPATRADVLGAPIPALTLGATGGGGPPYTWSDPTSSLPPGLTVSAAGVVTGTPTAAAPPYPHVYAVLLTVADKTLARTATFSISWTIRYQPLVVTNPGAQTDSVGHLVDPVQLAATGGRIPYSWSVIGLPAGLTMTSAGLITGTVTVTGSSTVTVTATDQQGTVASATFSWTVLAGPTITTPASQSTPVQSPVSVVVANTCANTPCTYSAVGLPPGLSFAGGTITGAPTSAGTFNNITVTVTDQDNITATSAPFSWLVTSGLSVTSPGNLSSRVGSPVKIRLTSACPATPCTYSLNNGPLGVAVDSTGLMTGTVAGGPQIYTVTITVRAANGSTATSAAFTWTVATNPGASVAATWPVFVSVGGSPDQPLAYDCQPNGNNPCTVSVTGLPPGVGLSATPNNVATNLPTSLQVSRGTGVLYLSGTVSGSAARGTTTVTLTISANGNSRSDSGSWTVQ